MADKLKKYQDIAKRMMAREKRLKEFQEGYERMARVQYQLPEPIRSWDWIRPIISTAPFDAVRGATRALSNLQEGLDIHPITVYGQVEDDDSKQAAKLANEWETTLKWSLGRSNKRRKDLREDVVWSASVYDMVIGQLIHVPTQMELTGAEPSRRKAALRIGDWALRVVDPKTVYVEWSDFGPERVLSVTQKTAREIVEYWGDKAGKVKKDMEKGPEKDRAKNAEKEFIEYDYVDHKNGRVVWVSEGPEADMQKSGEIIIGPEPWLKDVSTGDQVPFLPWIVSSGGTMTDQLPEYQLKPLLFPVLMAEQWASTNITQTLAMSKAMATALNPEHIIKGQGAEDVDIDYDTPGGRVELTPFQEYQQIQKQGLDQQLMQTFDRLEAGIQRATVADVLVTARPISGEQAFSSYNLQVQQALASLGGIRAVGQRFLERVYEAMLLISYYTGKDIEGYGDDLEKYTISSEDIDPDKIQLTVELKADVPADRVQRVTSAAQMAANMNYPMKRILKMLGETDPEGALEEWKMEQLDLADFQGWLQRVQADASGEMEQLVLQAAQNLVQQAQAQAAQQQEQQQAGSARQGIPGVGGQGFNPAQGGIPPVQAAPEASTFEGATGETRVPAP